MISPSHPVQDSWWHVWNIERSIAFFVVNDLMVSKKLSYFKLAMDYFFHILFYCG